MPINIVRPEGPDALSEFILFHDRVYEYRSARWPAALPMQLPVLLGDGPYARDRSVRPFLALRDGRPVARILAVIDQQYIRHWNEPLGHLNLFEALPDTREAVRMMLDAACEWLRGAGMRAARAGYGLFEFPFVIDEYETLPPSISRQNPAYYHCLLKDADFETERGWVDYRIEVTPELIARWQRALEAATRAGFRIVPVAKVPKADRALAFTSTWNEAFGAHWGATPFATEEVAQLFDFMAMVGALDTSFIAYRGDEAIGALLVMPENSDGVILAPGRVLHEYEKLNFLGIGVRASARGRGVNLAMASAAYLELVRRGAKFLSYTLVLDDNWPSRRTAEKLGARIWANYITYRRNLLG